MVSNQISLFGIWLLPNNLVDQINLLNLYLVGTVSTLQLTYKFTNSLNFVLRYGLVSYGSSATIFHLGGRYEKFGTRDQLLDALRSLSFNYGTGDIYVGISEIIESYSFRNSFDVRKHIVLFTAEVNNNNTLSAVYRNYIGNCLITTSVYRTYPHKIYLNIIPRYDFQYESTSV